MRHILLDASMLISAYDRDESKKTAPAVDGGETSDVDLRRRKRVEELAAKGEVRFWITPLIYYEVMRGLKHKSPVEMEIELEEYERLDIREDHGRQAVELYRLAKNKDKSEWLDKRGFDLFHCVCAEIDGMEFVHDDTGDIPKIQQLIQDSRKENR